MLGAKGLEFILWISASEGVGQPVKTLPIFSNISSSGTWSAKDKCRHWV
jgi:hypothetical protein